MLTDQQVQDFHRGGFLVCQGLFNADEVGNLNVTCNRLSEGDHRRRYYADKRKSYPPDCEREQGRAYVFQV